MNMTCGDDARRTSALTNRRANAPNFHFYGIYFNLVSCFTSTPINDNVFFFCRIPVVLESRRSSRGGGGGWGEAHPLHLTPRSAPEQALLCEFGVKSEFARVSLLVFKCLFRFHTRDFVIRRPDGSENFA